MSIVPTRASKRLRERSVDHRRTVWAVVRIGKRKSLAHKDGWMSIAPLRDRLWRQSIHVVLADAFHFGMLLKESLQPPFIFEETREIFGSAELPRHVSRCPQALASIVERLLKSVFKPFQQ